MTRQEREELAWLLGLARKGAEGTDTSDIDKDEIDRIQRWIQRRLSAYDRMRNVVLRVGEQERRS